MRRIMLIAMLVAAFLIGATVAASAHSGDHPTAYHIARQLYKRVDNDNYLGAFKAVGPGEKRIMHHAAADSCSGTLYEDFSCSGVRR